MVQEEEKDLPGKIQLLLADYKRLQAESKAMIEK